MENYIIDACGIKRTAVYLNCLRCDKQYLKIKKEIKRSKKHFCSMDCSRAHTKRNNFLIDCAWCNKKVEKKSSAIKKSKSGLFFCSLLCKNQAQSINGLPEITPKHYGTSKKLNTICLICGIKTYRVKYCKEHKILRTYKEYIEGWLTGIFTGNSGKTGEQINLHVRKYMFDKYNNKCVKCGWGETNLTSGRIPLTINHIDGNSTNSCESNLELICPNCHSLTSNYGSLNKGNGRLSRRKQHNLYTI